MPASHLRRAYRAFSSFSSASLSGAAPAVDLVRRGFSSRDQHTHHEQADRAKLAGQGADGRGGCCDGLLCIGQEGQLHQQQGKRCQHEQEAHQSDQLKDFFPVPDLAGGSNVLHQTGLVGKCSGVELDGILGGSLGEVVPGVDLTRLVNDALAAVRAGVPGVSLRSFLLQQGLVLHSR